MAPAIAIDAVAKRFRLVHERNSTLKATVFNGFRRTTYEEFWALDGVTFGKITLLPGWRWSESVKPIAGTASCEAPHTQYHISGRLAIRMDDGTEFVYGPGDVAQVPPGHDAWVVGDEPAVIIDVTGMTHYAERD